MGHLWSVCKGPKWEGYEILDQPCPIQAAP